MPVSSIPDRRYIDPDTDHRDSLRIGDNAFTVRPGRHIFSS